MLKNMSYSLLGACSLLALSQIMVGINIVGTKHLVATVPMFFILTVRFSVAACLLFALHWLSDTHKNCVKHYLSMLKKRDWFFIIAQALTAGALFNVLMITGLRYTSANMAGIITSTLPALIAFMSWIFLREKFTVKKMICVGLATLGLLVISVNNFKTSHVDQSFIGNLIILLAMLPEAAYYVLTKMYFNALPIFLISAVINSINALVFLPILLLTHGNYSFALPGYDWLILLIISVSSGLFFVFWYLGANRVDAVMASLSTAVMPVATVTIAWLFLKEVITGVQLLGMMLVISSIVVYALPKKKSPPF